MTVPCWKFIALYGVVRNALILEATLCRHRKGRSSSACGMKCAGREQGTEENSQWGEPYRKKKGHLRT